MNQKRRVRFNDNVEILRSVDDQVLCDTEIAAAWYSSCEIRQNKQLASALRKKRASLGAQECCRGLESHVDKSRRKRRRCYIEFVLEFQSDMKRKGMYNPDVVRTMAATMSKKSMELARSNGIEDAMDAFQVHSSDFQKSSTVVIKTPEMYSARQYHLAFDATKPELFAAPVA